MNFIFSNDLVESINLEPILISGPDSLNFTNKEYLILDSNGAAQSLFEIRYQSHCSPFKEAMIIDHILAVGFEEIYNKIKSPAEAGLSIIIKMKTRI